MRVLLIDQYGEYGGAQRGLLEAAAGFVNRGWELLAAVPDGPLSQRLSAMGAAVIPLRCGPFQPGRKRVGDAARFAAQISGQVATIARAAARADVLYVNGPRVAPAAALAASLQSERRPMVFHCHSLVPQ